MAKTKQCSECQDGDHGNYDDNVRLVVIQEPDDGVVHKSCWMCLDHRIMYEQDGYDVIERNP